MKKLLILFTLLASVSLSAQITEKDLLGTWKLSTATTYGVLMDFETHKVTVLEGYEEAVSRDDVQKIEQGIKGEHPFPLTVTFTEGKNIDFLIGKDTESYTYKLVTRNGKAFINDGTDEYEVQVENGSKLIFLYVDAEEGSEMTITFKK